MKKFEGAIFDIDGTIWDIFPIYDQAVREGMKSHGFTPPRFEDLIGMIKTGESFREKLLSMTRQSDEAAVFDGVMSEIHRTFQDLEERALEPYPGVATLFSGLRENHIKIGLATGRRLERERIRRICRRMGIEHFIDTVTSQRYVPNRKPAPDLILDCARRLGVPVEKCLVVGDTKDDILAAQEAGGTAIGIVSGIDNSEELMSCKPFGVVKGLTEILPLCGLDPVP